MANVLPREKQIYVIGSLAEGLSIRSIERLSGVHRDTIMRLGVCVGNGCSMILDKLMRNLKCSHLQLDEIWGFVGKKQKNVRYYNSYPDELGDAWTFIAIDSDTKAVPCYKVGKRDLDTACEFVLDLSNRLINRPQISSDSMKSYKEAIELAFGDNVDYGQIVKTYSSEKPLPTSTRYSPPQVVYVKPKAFIGNPVFPISTSFVEKQNHTMRMHCRRLARLTNAFSKKLENFKAAVALHFAYYNLVKIHKTIRMTPGMAIGVSDGLWSIEDLVDRALEQTK